MADSGKRRLTGWRQKGGDPDEIGLSHVEWRYVGGLWFLVCRLCETFVIEQGTACKRFYEAHPDCTPMGIFKDRTPPERCCDG